MQRKQPFVLPRPYIFGFAVFGMIMTVPGQTAGVSPFIDFLIDGMSTSRVQISLAYLIGTISSAFLLTPAGKLYDRLGSRIMGTIATGGLGLSLLVFTRAPGTASVLVAHGMEQAAATLLVMAIGFFLIRFCGQGVLELVSRTMLLKWFDDRRGMANAVFSGVMPVVFSMAPLAFNLLISGYGWQGAWRLLGILLMPGGALIAFFTFADPVRSSGPAPGEGGEDAEDQNRKTTPPPVPLMLAPLGVLARRIGLRRTRETLSPPRDRSLSEAMRDLSFWVFVIAITMSASLLTGLTFHIVGVFAEAGIGRGPALAMFFPSSVVTVVVLTVASVASDYIRLKYFAVLHGLTMALTFASILFLARGPVGYASLVLWRGMTMAMFGVNQAVVWPRFYGLTHLGAISGFAAAGMVAGSALGPYAFSLAFDLTGSFHLVSWVVIPLCLIIAALGFFADNPNR